jgi:hypothetical protein
MMEAVAVVVAADQLNVTMVHHVTDLDRHKLSHRTDRMRHDIPDRGLPNGNIEGGCVANDGPFELFVDDDSLLLPK